ncbi:S41 family peptidase [Lutimonas sp.]|uniref:S41 family peptidase n=1 Tax=Lutimonas sp. TaxID=1872403 RepID=UPI003D9B1AFC
MKKYFPQGLVVLLFLGLIACSDSNDIQETPVTPVDKVTLDDPLNSFIWQGMNSWYNWQLESEKLDDAKDDDLEEYYTFLNGYNDYRTLFYDLCYNHAIRVGDENATDRYSWFIDDYVAQNNAFQGIRTRYGFTQRTIQINNAGDVVIAILLVEKNSPAEGAGLKRGNIVNAINGTVLNENNLESAFSGLSNETVTLSLVTEDNGVLTDAGDITMTRALVAANPVHYHKIFTDIGGKKVGYLLYNSFADSYNDELNAVFADFKSEGIDELVLDLRFNGGGSGLATTYLASMIYAQSGNGVFYETKFNSKHSEFNSADIFQDVLEIQNTELEVIGEEPINRISTLSRLYVLTTGSSASASELLINGLRPYMSSVKLIGTQTEGKNVGSITLYDTPETDFLGQNNANPNHKYAMQPICIQVFNKNGESDYIQGFAPDIEVDDSSNWNNVLPFGDRNEVMLKVALDDIAGIVAKQSLSKLQLQAKEIKMSFEEDKFANEMYFNHLIKRNLKE